MMKAFIYHNHSLVKYPNKNDIIYVYWGTSDTSIAHADAALQTATAINVMKSPHIGCEIKTYKLAYVA